MSLIENEKGSAVFSISSGALGSGTATVLAVANLQSNSKLLSIVRTVIGGTQGVPRAFIVLPAAGSAGYNLTVNSSNSADTSTYTVYWVNPYIPSPSLAQGSSSVNGANVQFAP